MSTHPVFYVFLLSLVALLGCTPAVRDASEPATVVEDTTAKNTYDAAKADAYGADAYGMKTYIFAYLKRGPKRDLSQEEASRLQAAHLTNIRRLAEANKLVLAGPFLDDGDIRGFYIFDVATVEEAAALTATDPAIRAGSLAMELVPWYGSAALLEVNRIHQTLEKQSFAD